MARQIGTMLNAREPKIVNGPEILNKYVGASEENIRKLFADAEKEVSSNISYPESVVETSTSIKPKATKVDCTSSSSMSWTLSASNVVRRIAVPVWATVLSTSFCLRFVNHHSNPHGP